MRFRALLFLVCCYTISFSQDLEIIHVNPENFPIVEAIIHSEDDFGPTEISYQKEDFSITEANSQHEIIHIENPKNKELSLSILMVFDVSGSMNGERMRIVQNAAINFISRVPLQYSEIAITSFNETAVINCDFTHNRNKLLQTLSNLQTFGGTSYNEAYLNYEIGAMEFVRRGKHKKVIIFLTDGMSNVDYIQVIEKAKALDVPIYNVTVALPMASELKQISRQTGGSFYESAQSEGELDSIFMQMLGQIQSELYGKIYWKAPYGCIAERSGTLSYMGREYRYSYTIPASKVSKLQSGLDELVFGEVRPGSQKSLNVEFSAMNAPIVFRQALINGGVFQLAKPFEEFTLVPGQEQKLAIKYVPTEEGLQKGNLNIQIENCPDRAVALSGGVKESLRIIRPKGNDKFLVGVDTSILWKGIKAGREVNIAYRHTDSVPWNYIGVGTNHKAFWTIPDAVSDEVHVRLALQTVVGPNVLFEKEIENYGLVPDFLGFNREGSKIVLSNNRGEVMVVDRYNNNLLLHARGLGNKGFCYSKLDSIISFDKNQVTVHNGTFGNTIATLPTDRNVFSSHVLHDGKEYLMPAIIKRKKDGKTIIRSIYYDNEDTLSVDKLIRHAAITSDGERAVTINIERDLKIWDLKEDKVIFEEPLEKLENRYIVSPSQKTLLVEKSNGALEMMDLTDASILFSLTGYPYYQFAKSGNFFMSIDEDSSMHLIDSYTGGLLKTFPQYTPTRNPGHDYMVLYVHNDSLILEDLKNQTPIQSFYSPGITDIVVSQDDSKILVLSSTGVHSLLHTDDLRLISELRTDPREDYNCSFSNSGQEIIIGLGEGSVELWSPEVEEFESVMSEKFSIVKPRIDGVDSVDLGIYFVNEQVNIPVNNIYRNSSDFAIDIEDVEIQGNNFQLVNYPKKHLLKPGGAQGVEINFSPMKEGKYFGHLVAYTQFDTLFTVVCAQAISTSIEMLNNPVNLGTVLLNESKDTTLAVLTNSGTEPVSIKHVSIAGPDTSQIALLVHTVGQYIQPGDTLLLSLRFIGKEGGRTSTQMQFYLNYPDSLKRLNFLGEVIAPQSIIVAAQAFNVSDSLPIDAKVECVDLESNYKIKQEDTTDEGRAFFKAYPGRVIGIFAAKQGYFSSSEKLDLLEGCLEDTVYNNIYLTEIKPAAKIRLNCIFFDYNSSALKTGSWTELQRIVDMLNSNRGIKIEIQGHTDNIGGRDFNINLSKRRAEAIKDYLILQGIDRDRLFVKAFGYSKPVASNEEESGRVQNRRVEVMVR